MISIGIFAKTFQRNSVLEILQAVKQHGFTHVQLNMACVGLASMPEVIPPEVIDEIQIALQQTGIQISGVSGTFNMCHPNIQDREDGIKKLKILAASAHDIGTDLITLCTGTRNPVDKWTFHPDNHSSEAWQDMVDTMEQAIDIAEKNNIYLGIEPEHANIVQNAPKAFKLIRELQSDRIKVILDPANLFEQATILQIKELLAEAIDLLAPHIVMLHAKDRDQKGNFVAPGKGIIPFDFMLEQVSYAGIDAPLIAHGFTEREVEFVGSFLKNHINISH